MLSLPASLISVGELDITAPVVCVPSRIVTVAWGAPAAGVSCFVQDERIKTGRTTPSVSSRIWKVLTMALGQHPIISRFLTFLTEALPDLCKHNKIKQLLLFHGTLGARSDGERHDRIL